MAKLEICVGNMFSGKSTELTRKYKKLCAIGKKCLVVKPLIDNRYGEGVVTHDSYKVDCITISNIKDIFSNDINLATIDTILIDEAQFFNNLKEDVLNLVENKNINVFIAGLDGDFKRNKFGEILDLIPYADKLKKLRAYCKICNDGTKASFSKRIIKNDSQIMIGATNEYIPVCRKHYLSN